MNRKKIKLTILSNNIIKKYMTINKKMRNK